MRHAVLLCLAVLVCTPVHATNEVDTLSQECRKVAKRQGTLGDRAKMSALAAAVRSADRTQNADRLDLALTEMQKFCHTLRTREPLR